MAAKSTPLNRAGRLAFPIYCTYFFIDFSKFCVSTCTNFCSPFLILFLALLQNKHTFGKIPVFDGLGDIVSNLYIIEEHVSWNQERLLVLLEGLVQVFFKQFSFSR